MRNKKIVWLVIISLLVVACGSGTAPTEESNTGVEPVSTSEGSAGGDSASDANLVLDPANASGDNALAVVGYLYEGLVKVSEGNVVPALAESYSASEDGLDYIFNLRPGVAFHDGSTLNADVVVLNFNRWFDPADANRGAGEYAAWLANFAGFKGELTEDGKPKSQYDGVEKVDELTVLVHLNTVDPDFLTKLANPAFSIVSANAFAQGDGGTGAYTFASSDGTNFILEPFAGYWDSAMLASEAVTVPAP